MINAAAPSVTRVKVCPECGAVGEYAGFIRACPACRGES